VILLASIPVTVIEITTGVGWGMRSVARPRIV
jgi:hypothetical protein